MRKVFFVSLGCDKNRVDSEKLISRMMGKEFIITNNEEEAHIIIVNTCAFIDSAKEESINTLIEMGEYKNNKNCEYLIATGCLAQRYASEIKKEIPEVDGVLGTSSQDKILELIKELDSNNGHKTYLEDINKKEDSYRKRVITTPSYYAYLKISEGCDKNCTYCIIPKLRGKYKSTPIEDLLDEANMLVKNGVKEIILVAQETTLYGVDIYGEKSLVKLLRELEKIESLEKIRILYAYPEEIEEELILEIKRNKKVVHYIDMPIQHGSNRILKLMGRKTSREDIINKVNMIRSHIPDMCIRTTTIVGFPGETMEELNELISLIKTVKFNHLGCFTYSKEEDTAAYNLEGHISEEEKVRRQNLIMETQQKISREKLKRYIACELDLFVEGYLRKENVYLGFGEMNAPNIDGVVFFESDRELMTGDKVRVIIEGSTEYDLYGSII